MTTTECSILIVDDDYLIATELSQHLAAEGFEVVGPFSHIDDARRTMERKSPDCVLLDINLGGGQTSFAFAEDLESRGIPFAFVTGYNSLPNGEERFAQAKLLLKPVEPAKAAEEARRMCESRGEPG